MILDQWKPFATFDPTIHQDNYLFSDGHNTVYAHWFAPHGTYPHGDGARLALAYIGEELCFEPTHWFEHSGPPK